MDVIRKLGSGREIGEVCFKFKLSWEHFCTEWHLFSSSTLLGTLKYSGILSPTILERLVIVGAWNDIEISAGFLSGENDGLLMDHLRWNPTLAFLGSSISLDLAPLTDHWPGPLANMLCFLSNTVFSGLTGTALCFGLPGGVVDTPVRGVALLLFSVAGVGCAPQEEP